VPRISRILAEAAGRLAATSDSPQLDAEMLLARVLGRSRASLRSHGEDLVPQSALESLGSLVARRAAGEPLAYLTGRRGFWSFELDVSPAVLVPRPETELLVEIAVGFLRDRASPSVLELGTGSGAIAIALGLELPGARIVASDASAAALAIARRNAARAVVDIEFLCGDWYEAVEERRFDAIVANPPYLSATDPHLPALAHEPVEALVAGPTGLEALAHVVAGAADHLSGAGLLLLEHGCEQGTAVRECCARAGLVEVVTRTDLSGLERATLARRPA
jgi:release factor glutamine methyltransferase